MEQSRPYNLSKLLYYILKSTPKQKRLLLADNMNQNQAMWQDNDDFKDYRKGILEFLGETVSDCVLFGTNIGEHIGAYFGHTGEAIGRVAGTLLGGAVGVVKAVVRGLPMIGRFFG